MDTVQNADWWRSAVIYQIYPRSFLSTTGKGVGDLAGIAAKSDYLKRLGVDVVWISPFFKSPMHDYGYDISDYRSVDPLFGSLDDFDRVVEQFHACGLKVMIDQVYNHTSNEHPWFKESRTDKSNPKANWYVWKDPTPTGNPPNNWLSVFSTQAWTWHSERRQYYMHQFLREQPDLNFHLPEVQKAILDVAEFWFRRKVDGFRLDTASRYASHPDCPDNPPFTPPPDSIPINPHGMQKELYNQGQPETLAFLRRLRTLANRYDNKLLLGELGSYNECELQEQYTAGGDALHIAYTFGLLHDAVTPRLVADVWQNVARYSKAGWPSWSFSNHDVVRPLTRNTAVDSRDHDSYAKMLLTLLLSLRGTPCIYQGEELALPDQDLDYHELRDPYSKNIWPKWRGRDGCRTPLPWHKDKPHGGFSVAEPWLPVKANHLVKAVDQQEDDPASTLNFYRQFIPWRKEQTALCGTGALQIEEVSDELLTFVREGSPSIYCAYNFSPTSQEIECGGTLIPHPNGTASQRGETVKLPPYGTAFLKI